ncbi:MAG: serine/threonine-protein kinase [Myxococcales bacterium]
MALKVLWPGDESEQTRKRLLAEAQSLARIDHPNVVSVFDVGCAGDELFVAMELVRGRTLRRWLADESRAPGSVGGSAASRTKPPLAARILEAYRQAGAGLEAAHLAGLVHRDFKPENALIDEQGRVRVLDFGLALPARAGAATPAGTPRYMAPEQRAGGAVDHRSDQYSFCASLAEALGSAATSRVAAALKKGQSESPDERYPSMSALLSALDPSPRRRRFALAGAGLALVALFATALQARRLVPCSGAGEQVGRVWARPVYPLSSGSGSGGSFSVGGLSRGERQRKVAGALPGPAEPVLRQLDALALAFEQGFANTCTAYRRSEISGELLDQRMACLGDALAQLDSSIKLLERSGDHAGTILAALPNPDDCQRPRRVEADLPAPKAREVQALRRELAALRPFALAADPMARDRAVQLREHAQKTGLLALFAEAKLVEALLRIDPDARRQALLEAVAASERAGSDAVRAEALLALAEGLSGEERARTLWLAQAALERAGPEPRLERTLAQEQARSPKP